MNIILSLLIIGFIFYTTKLSFIKCSTNQKVFLLVLLIGHYTSMCFAYQDTIDFPGCDAFNFYKNAVEADSWVELIGLGSTFMTFLIYPLVKAGVNLFVLTLLFATISYQAFLLLFGEMRKSKTNNLHFYGIPISQFFFLLPSLHYWSGFLGKDVLVFFILTYLLFEFKNKASIHFLHIFALLLFLLLRLHIFMAVFVAVIIYFFTQKDVAKELKIKMSILALGILSISISIIASFEKINNLTLGTILEKWKEINWFALHSGSGIDLSELSYIGRVGLLLFRPLFYDAKTDNQYFISIENCVVLLMVSLISFGLFAKRKQIKMANEVKMAFLIAICNLLLISVYIYNLGLASRMRLMIMPFLFYALHQIYCNNVDKNKIHIIFPFFKK
ncbi:hypothetical protein [Flavobacterium cellulosilyticum]|uniref:EpsG family protein n=1 Tax=Flavobacterium cellulosilyticum TaxID=2541731 RepID=A0A4R5CLM8_9FLAO|nr:hypothetical protein [Flavobacterium cellulosilyticum]TDD98382.1 hypothetical protein E0F76_04375 [Flavobacterium cellulosilyticum]